MSIVQGKNIWGKAGGLEIQRSDLWVVDLSALLTSIITARGGGGSVPSESKISAPYLCSSITFPELKVQSQPYFRNSQPYHMPAYDSPLDPVRMTFLVDAPTGNKKFDLPKIYDLLKRWRDLVRTGRDDVTGEVAQVVPLPSAAPQPASSASHGVPAAYSPKFRFNVDVFLLRGQSLDSVPDANSSDRDTLDSWANFRLTNCWLSSFQMSELNYASNGAPMTVAAQIYAESIVASPKQTSQQAVIQTVSEREAGTKFSVR